VRSSHQNGPGAVSWSVETPDPSQARKQTKRVPFEREAQHQ